MAQPSSALNTAFKAARRAGDMMLRAANNLSAFKADGKAAGDFVSDVGKQAEDIIADILREAYPHHCVRIGEAGESSNARAEYEWLINPLDGATNYLHGHPQYAVSMALLHKGVLQEALVYAPERNDLYTASRGQGALLNDRRIRVSARTEMNRCVIGTGCPVADRSSVLETYLALLKGFICKTAGIRQEGAAALDLCTLAAGRTDGFFDFRLNPQDIAAGALIVQEAGGIVTDMHGEQGWLQSGDMVAAPPKVLAQMLTLIRPHIK